MWRRMWGEWEERRGVDGEGNRGVKDQEEKRGIRGEEGENAIKNEGEEKRRLKY